MASDFDKAIAAAKVDASIVTAIKDTKTLYRAQNSVQSIKNGPELERLSQYQFDKNETTILAFMEKNKLEGDAAHDAIWDYMRNRMTSDLNKRSAFDEQQDGKTLEGIRQKYSVEMDPRLRDAIMRGEAVAKTESMAMIAGAESELHLAAVVNYEHDKLSAMLKTVMADHKIIDPSLRKSINADVNNEFFAEGSNARLPTPVEQVIAAQELASLAQYNKEHSDSPYQVSPNMNAGKSPSKKR